jgi:hypothetical protein
MVGASEIGERVKGGTSGLVATDSEWDANLLKDQPIRGRRRGLAGAGKVKSVGSEKPGRGVLAPEMRYSGEGRSLSTRPVEYAQGRTTDEQREERIRGAAR